MSSRYLILKIDFLQSTIGIESNPGFMSSTVDGVVLGMKSFLASADRMNQLDPFVVPLPWRDDLFNGRKDKQLRVGWYDQDGFFPVVPGCKRALHDVLQVTYTISMKSLLGICTRIPEICLNSVLVFFLFQCKFHIQKIDVHLFWYLPEQSL